jgi:outer membrane receptor protein involved in Fe transport
MTEAPLNGRDPVQLMMLVAGVQPYNGAGLTSGTTYPGLGGVTVNGNRGNSTNYILDGGQNNDHYSNAPNPMPNPDALQEFSVQTNNFSAEFGRNSGGNVNAVTKSVPTSCMAQRSNTCDTTK